MLRCLVVKDLSKQRNHYNVPSIILYINQRVRKISEKLTFRNLVWNIISVTFIGLFINKQMSTQRTINIRRQFQLHVISILHSKTMYCKIMVVHCTLIKLKIHSLDLSINVTILFHYRNPSFQQEMLI